MDFVCHECGERVSFTTLEPNCSCGGLWTLDNKDISFEMEKVNKDNWSLFRYREFISLKGDSYKEISLGEGMSPIVRYDDNVLLKMDYFMPTLSYKDRGAAVLISHCKDIGVKSVVQDSSGNAGNSVAAYAAKAGIECEIFVPEGTSPKKIDMIKSHGAKINIVPGSRDNCADVCRQKVKDEGAYYANHVYNPMFYEGTKTYILEVYEELKRIPDYIFVPVGNGTLYLGVVKGLEELLRGGYIEKFPKIIAIQSEYCDPLYQSYLNGEKNPTTVNAKPTLAEGIAIGRPARGKEILEYSKKYDIEFTIAPENKILEARASLAKKGIYVEHTTAAIFAAYLNYVEENGEIKDVLIPLTGAGLKSDH
ncbi:MAG: pyridoxal-phosphate dependent enzyme [Tissierellia bacterium]|nr:pyridoxal-phosphate dependent enzyme [Tissierellia bacterium]